MKRISILIIVVLSCSILWAGCTLEEDSDEIVADQDAEEEENVSVDGDEEQEVNVDGDQGETEIIVDGDATEDEAEVIVDGDATEDEAEVNTATLDGVSNSSCLGERDDDPFGEESFEATYDPVTGLVTAVHHNVIYNCCIDDISIEMVIVGTTIQLWETEELTMPCDCLCPYDVTAEIADLPEGAYTIEFYTWGSLVGQAEAVVGDVQGPELLDYSNSGCLGDVYRAPPEPLEDFEASYDSITGLLTAIHRNAMYNCCLDGIVVDMNVDGYTIQLWETEMLTTPCYCICPIDVTSRIDGLADGIYTVEFYSEGEFVGSTEAIVGDVVTTFGASY